MRCGFLARTNGKSGRQKVRDAMLLLNRRRRNSVDLRSPGTGNGTGGKGHRVKDRPAVDRLSVAVLAGGAPRWQASPGHDHQRPRHDDRSAAGHFSHPERIAC